MTDNDSNPEARAPGRLTRILKSTTLRIVLALLVLGVLVYFNRIDAHAFGGVGGRWPWLALAFALMLPTYLIVSCRF